VAAAHGREEGAGGHRRRRTPGGVVAEADGRGQGAGGPRRRRRPWGVGAAAHGHGGGRAALGGEAAVVPDGVRAAVPTGQRRVRRVLHDDGQGLVECGGPLIR
jgi:hypothetical protein